METSAADTRLGQLISHDASTADSAKLIIVGFPSDEGVRRNNGRPGAAGGPKAIREQLYRMTPAADNYQPVIPSDQLLTRITECALYQAFIGRFRRETLRPLAGMQRGQNSRHPLRTAAEHTGS